MFLSFLYAPELFEQMFVHGDNLQDSRERYLGGMLHRWNEGIHLDTSAAESKLIPGLRLEYTAKSDLFAFGTVLFHLFSGHLQY